MVYLTPNRGPDPTPELPAAKRKLQWQEACDGGAWWWMTDDPDTDTMLSEDEHTLAAAVFEVAAEYLESKNLNPRMGLLLAEGLHALAKQTAEGTTLRSAS